MEALNDLRQDIDALDAQLAALYRRRMDVAARIAAVKREQDLPVLQPEREQEIRARLAELAAPALQPGMQAWFEALRAASRDWQESSPAPGASLRCGLLGEHLRHSYSPEIHAMLGAYSYDLFEVPPEGLADFLHGAAWDGLNVTIPYKRAVVPFCTALSPMAEQTGSVNTLVRRADGTLYGANTDAGGFRLLLKRGGGIAPGEKALVLGSGGASQTVQAVLRAQGAEVVVISGAGLEDFLDGILDDSDIIDSSDGTALLHAEEEHDHGHEDHHHEDDPHIWLSPENAKIMAGNICTGLSQRYPEYADTFSANLDSLLEDLDALQSYGESSLSGLKCREMVTFHDGFSYFAQAFDLTILEAVEEESGSEASAQELKHLIGVVRENDLPAIFTERNGSTSAAGVISRETGVTVYSLDMAMAGDSYFDAMYRNIDTIKEALG